MHWQYIKADKQLAKQQGWSKTTQKKIQYISEIVSRIIFRKIGNHDAVCTAQVNHSSSSQQIATYQLQNYRQF